MAATTEAAKEENTKVFVFPLKNKKNFYTN